MGEKRGGSGAVPGRSGASGKRRGETGSERNCKEENVIKGKKKNERTKEERKKGPRFCLSPAFRGVPLAKARRDAVADERRTQRNNRPPMSVQLARSRDGRRPISGLRSASRGPRGRRTRGADWGIDGANVTYNSDDRSINSSRPMTAGAFSFSFIFSYLFIPIFFHAFSRSVKPVTSHQFSFSCRG